MAALAQLTVQILIPFLLLVVAYGVGSYREKKHFRSIRLRERSTAGFPMITFRSAPEGWEVRSAALVTGSVLISLDYFKRFVAGLRGIVGGRVAGYESLLDRARREALLRMKERAIEQGFDAIINVRFESSRLANARQDGKGTAGVEMLVYGTALRLGHDADGNL